MRTIFCYLLAVSLGAFAFAAQQPSSTKKAPVKKAPVKKSAAKTVPHRTTTPSAHTASSKSGKKAPAKRTTWRNRQTAPSPERYKEIQDALVAKGYLKPEDANGSWNQASADGLKRFQTEQNIEASGKINSLSLIALGLGPKRDSTPAKPAENGPPQDH